MKKRVCRHHCELCNLSFETWDRYFVHFQSRGHLVNELNSSEKQDIELVGDDHFPGDLDPFAEDRDVDMGKPRTCARLQNSDYPAGTLSAEEEISSDNESDDGGGDDATTSNFQGSFSADEKTDGQPSFYPFPSELFFLLYSYAHNVSRPKVSCICSHYQCVCILTILKCKYFFLGIPTVILVLNVVNLLFKEAYYNYPNYY